MEFYLLFGSVTQQLTLWDQYQKWVHMLTLTKHGNCNHLLALRRLLFQALQVLDRYLQ